MNVWRGRLITLESPHYTLPSGREYFDTTMALAHLLANDVLFVNTFPLWNDKTKQPEPATSTLFVLCNELFGPGADCEEIPYSSIESIYRAFDANGPRGVLRWCCLHRGQRPSPRIESLWRELGIWDAELEALPTTQVVVDPAYYITQQLVLPSTMPQLLSLAERSGFSESTIRPLVQKLLDDGKIRLNKKMQLELNTNKEESDD